MNYEELEKLKDYLISERECYISLLIEKLVDIDEFDRGRYSGYLSALDTVFDYIRQKLKYGEN